MHTVNKLEGNFGVEILGIDLSAGVSTEQLHVITQTLYENQIIVLREQNLTKDQYLAFGRQWGTPIPHVLDHIRMQDYPEMMTVGNTEKRDREDKIRNGAALWHTDQSYEQEPASTTMLYSIKQPATGGETQFCNMTMAWQEINEERKAPLKNLQVKHKYGYGARRPDELTVNPLINEDQDAKVPPVLHPLVMNHPIVDREMFYALGHGAYGIEGMPQDDAERLIASLKDHVLQECFIYRHAYEAGDVVIWDTLQTMHCATPIELPESSAQERLLWRISVRHKPAIYQ